MLEPISLNDFRRFNLRAKEVLRRFIRETAGRASFDGGCYHDTFSLNIFNRQTLHILGLRYSLHQGEPLTDGVKQLRTRVIGFHRATPEETQNN